MVGRTRGSQHSCASADTAGAAQTRRHTAHGSEASPSHQTALWEREQWAQSRGRAAHRTHRSDSRPGSGEAASP